MFKSIEQEMSKFFPDKMYYRNLVAVNPCVFIKEAAKKNNLTITDLAEKTNISEKELTNIYQGFVPSNNSCFKLSRALNMPDDYLLNRRLEYLVKRQKILNAKYQYQIQDL